MSKAAIFPTKREKKRKKRNRVLLKGEFPNYFFCERQAPLHFWHLVS